MGTESGEHERRAKMKSGKKALNHFKAAFSKRAPNFLLMVVFTGMALPVAAYIPRLSTIVQRTVEHSGKGTYRLEQEVLFSVGAGDPLALREVWTVSDEDQMVLEVRGSRELKDGLFWQFQYQGSQRTQLTSRGRVSRSIPVEYADRWWWFRKPETMNRFLQSMNLLPAAFFSKQVPRQGKEFVYPTHPNLRLARSGGVVNWALGEPSPVKGDLKPGVWIEQDAFLVRRVRFESGSEISADGFVAYPRGLMFPRSRSIRWEGQEVSIQVLSVSAISKVSSFTLTESRGTELPNALPERELVEAFYSRFR